MSAIIDVLNEKVSEPLLSSFLPQHLNQKTILSYALIALGFVILIFALNFATLLMVNDDDKIIKDKKKKSKIAPASTKIAQNVMVKESFKGLAIVGAPGSGKTTLYYQLMTGEYRETVSSIDENYTGSSGLSVCRLKNGQETVEKKIECIDIPGHFNFRERV